MDPGAVIDRIDTGTGGRFDVTRLCHDGPSFEAVVDDLAAPFDDGGVDRVAGIDAVGFVLGAAVARELDVGFVPVRKGGKLPIPDDDRLEESLVDYTETEKRLELDRTAVPPSGRVLVVDDWIETAAQMTAAVALVEAAGGEVAGIATVGAGRDTTEALRAAYRFHSLLPLR